MAPIPTKRNVWTILRKFFFVFQCYQVIFQGLIKKKMKSQKILKSTYTHVTKKNYIICITNVTDNYLIDLQYDTEIGKRWTSR